MIEDINSVKFPAAEEGDKIIWSDGKEYVYTNGKWVLENNN